MNSLASENHINHFTIITIKSTTMTTYSCMCCLTIGHLSTAPPIPKQELLSAASHSVQHIFLQSEYVWHSRSGLTVRRTGNSTWHCRDSFFLDPQTILSVLREITGMTDPWPEVFNSVTRIAARIALRAAMDPVLADAPVLPVNISVLINPMMSALDEVVELSWSEAEAAGPVPADKLAVEALEELSVEFYEGVDSDDQCCICMNGFRGLTFDDLDDDEDEGEEFAEKVLLKMPCSHVYHKNCLVKWLERSNLCPLCRHALPMALD